MDLILDPPHGAGPVRLGMTPGEALAAVAPWGAPRVVPADGRPPKKIHTACREIMVNVLLEGSGEAVTAVELWWPGEGRRTDVRVLLDGDDVFTTPAEDLFRKAEARGRTVDGTEPEYPFVPGVSLGFTRWTSQEVPRTRGGLPVHVTSVLVGGEDYYDFRVGAAG
ncbi:hypothetical protein M4914_08555 [Streptomyces somaliensis DSM 40738]|uniref:Uncharacterized protein n=1 Tax=Streptomyces somaliensis (strain ATCC 33201 / DSM 40738 / JCM 12659 / KCTC 9044 / NCTC 11332 / NRRL B-12077 / IP 733) TaxID=1134445 RepID=A0AA44DEI7_STRE0|nr:hypothetical protein [Streptomyces somaliensis]MCQ0022992.1 hypothetical protein [Streptomyces somaliensis DSM 40738]NKY15332.1 hypothetical protein [Streptomyces somaliensis DSM 40738]